MTTHYAVTKGQIDAALDELAQEHGYQVQKAKWCCSSCACADMDESNPRWAFYHQQDAERGFNVEQYNEPRNVLDDEYEEEPDIEQLIADLDDDAPLEEDMYLGWGGDAHLIQAIFAKHGVVTSWDGSTSTRILLEAKPTGSPYEVLLSTIDELRTRLAEYES